MEEKTMPSLEMVNSNMDKDNKKYSFEIESIDRQIPVPQLTKLGEQVFLYRKKINIRTNPMPYVIKSVYYLVDTSGNILGKLPVYNNGHSDTLEIDYHIKPEYQGQGLGTIALSTVVDDIFSDREFDNIPFRENMLEEEITTSIESVYLSISNENVASQIVATRNGFVKTSEGTFVMTKDDYNKSQGIDTRKK